MIKYLKSLTDADFNVIRNSFQSALGEDWKTIDRKILIKRIVDYCKGYRFTASDIRSRYFN